MWSHLIDFHLSIFTYLDYVCYMSVWFLSDKNECRDENACQADGVRICVNLIGSFKCICLNGYQHPEIDGVVNEQVCEGKVLFLSQFVYETLLDCQ